MTMTYAHAACSAWNTNQTIGGGLPRPTAEEPSMDDQLTAAHDAMKAKGLDVAIEYPGAISIQVTPTLSVWTGLHGFDYGSASALDESGCYQPLEDMECDVEGITEDSSPEEIADAWAAWVREQRVAASVERAKGEILADMASGIVPEDVDSFSLLHDFVDANEYGGLCDDSLLDGEHFPEEHTALANTVQDRVDEWLRAGRPS